MLRKTYSRSGNFCRITFELPAEMGATTASLCGEFNGWDKEATPMVPRKGGRLSVTLSLAANREYRFRYLIDGERWENDKDADAYVLNVFGSEDSVLKV